jgi:Tol biopolymer transport system component
MRQIDMQSHSKHLASIGALLGSVVLLICSAVAAETPSWKLISDAQKSAVWRVSSNGSIAKVDFPFFNRKTNSGISIGSSPLPSPDQRKIAYIKSNDLWLYDIDTNVDQRLTNIGQPEDDKFASVFVAAITWSSDSKKILYRVLSGLTEPELLGHGEAWKKEKREAEFGTRVLDINTRASSSIEVQGIPDSLPVWLPNGKFLVVMEGASYGKLDDELHLLNADTHESLQIIQERAWYSRPVVSADGRWALVNAGTRVGPDLISPGKDLRSQLKKINLENGKVTNVTQLGRWAEYYSYVISPSGSGTAYFWRKSPAPNNWRGSVVVDGRELYSHDGLVSVYWINEMTVAIFARSEIVVLDARSGNTIGVHRH